MRSDDEIQNIIREALSPVDIEIELQDYDSKIRFTAQPKEGSTVPLFDGEPLDSLRDGDKLYILLRAARKRLKRRGIELGAWEHDSTYSMFDFRTCPQLA